MVYLFPQSGYNAQQTTLVQPVGLTDTTIYTANAAGFPMRNGRISIDQETVFYGSRDNVNFYNCVRGSENTTPVTHLSGATVNENNVWLYYYKLPFLIPVNADDSISSQYLNMSMEVYDEHLESIIDYTTYKLLKKIDIERANEFKTDFTAWLQEAKDEIDAGRQDMMQNSDIRSQYYFENTRAYNYGMY
jgi:hypothetical protein